jgi:hypothetical protein
MTNTLLRGIAATALCSAMFCGQAANALTIDYLGYTAIPGTTTDTSGLPGTSAPGFPQDRMGGFGSGIAYSGFGNTYLFAPDRGPNDGISSYIDRVYEMTLDIQVSSTPGQSIITPGLGSLKTTVLSQSPGVPFVGTSSAFSTPPGPNDLRLDTEAVRIASSGKSYFVSDEYGPFIYEFDRATGQRIRSIAVPDKFLIANPNATAATEIANNTTKGRVTNRGMEGLAISPDGTKLFGLMQSPLAQDGGTAATAVRLLEVNLADGKTKEYAYQLGFTNNGAGVNEIVAINDHQFLVIERDNGFSAAAQIKKIYKIDINGATDVSNIPDLRAGGFTPVQKDADISDVDIDAFIDLLDPTYNIRQQLLDAGIQFPEKVEGVAFGPDLEDGRHLLWVTVDNDFLTERPSVLLAFGIGGDDFDFVAQSVPEPGSMAIFAFGALALGAFGRRGGAARRAAAAAC